MRLLRLVFDGNISLIKDLSENIPPYAILSHTWGDDDNEVKFAELGTVNGQEKSGYKKIEFCVKQAGKDGFQHSWVDTCCINKASLSELSEAITSTYRWYARSQVCYAYLSDVLIDPHRDEPSQQHDLTR